MKVKFLNSVSSSRLSEHGYTKKEEIELFDKMLQEVYDNPRWFLDNLDELTTFQVFWANSSPKSPIMPYRHTKEPKDL